MKGLLCAVLLWGTSAAALAAPALSGGIIRDLDAAEQALAQGRLERVVEHAGNQADRLTSGNAADRYASALYRQLIASALTQQKRYADAAEQLAQAQDSVEAGTAQARRWLQEEARLHHAAGQHDLAITRLGQWLEGSAGSATSERWRMVDWLARQERWQEAAAQLDKARDDGQASDAGKRELALAVDLNAGRMQSALDALVSELNAQSDAAGWRKAAGIAQRAGRSGVAAGIWDTGWQLGRLDRPADYWQLVDLHLAGGTPARAAELLEAGLAEGRVVRSELSLRLRATAWRQARKPSRALATQRALAQHTRRADEWRTLGQLAYAWGEDDQAKSAFEHAVALGDTRAEKWLAGF
ncbi:MAG: hypothetical protein L0J54_01865 [Halomonas sp.]|nr:hypothetical protein [Halomonas sp.]MDN6296758.1 hypothetical protein [Halomonas sp.]MDN6314032.1 hypothetical protein [Halomonas sp.]MDN6335424.1 hypothetical protein [Halomonas sp.]